MDRDELIKMAQKVKEHCESTKCVKCEIRKECEHTFKHAPLYWIFESEGSDG